MMLLYCCLYRKNAGQAPTHIQNKPCYDDTLFSSLYRKTPQGKLPQAEELHRRALKIRQYTLGDEHPSTVASLSYLAVSLRAQGKTHAGDLLLRRAGEIRSASRSRGRNFISASGRSGSSSWGSKEWDGVGGADGDNNQQQQQLEGGRGGGGGGGGGRGTSIWGGAAEGRRNSGGGGGGGGANAAAGPANAPVVSMKPIPVFE